MVSFHGSNLRAISSGGYEERWRMRPDQAAPQPEMVNAASEVLSEGTIPAVGGYVLVTMENCEEGKRQANCRRPRPVVALLAILGRGLQITLQLFQGLEVEHGLPIYGIQITQTDEAVLNCDSGDFMNGERFEDYEGIGRQHLERSN
jgi:hypothetical protein